MIVTIILLATIVALVIWGGKRAALSAPRRPFLTEAQVRILEVECEIIPPLGKVDSADLVTRLGVMDFATQVISAGNSAYVKAALRDFGVARVSLLQDDQLEEFAQRLKMYASDDDDGMF